MYLFIEGGAWGPHYMPVIEIRHCCSVLPGPLNFSQDHDCFSSPMSSSPIPTDSQTHLNHKFQSKDSEKVIYMICNAVKI